MSLVNITKCLKYFSKFVNFQYIFVLIFLTFLFIYLKLVLKRYKFSKVLPCNKFNPFSLLADLIYLPLPKKGHNLHIFTLQMSNGFMNIFQKEKLYCLWLCFLPLIVITNPSIIEEFLSGTKTLKKSFLYKFLHPWLGKGLLTSDGSKWKSRRKLLTQSFHFDILKDFLHVFNENAKILCQVLQKESEKEFVNIITPMTLCSLDIICETTLGVCIKAQENQNSEYVKSVSSVLNIIATRMCYPWYWPDRLFFLTGTGKQFKYDVRLLHKFTRGIIREKKEKILSGDVPIFKKKRKALMDILLEHHIESNSLTEEDIREEVDTFVFEGHDTTAFGMTWALYLIGLNEKIQANLAEEMDCIFGEDYQRPVTTEDLKDMDYLERVIKEALRLYPPVPIFAREIEEEIELGGYLIPKGTQCAVLPYTLHRNKNIYPNPEVFDPDRFLPEASAKRHPYAYLPFSAGSRNCIGQRFAMMELKVVISHILRYFSLKSLDERDKVLPAAEIILRPFGPIRIKLTPRH